MGSKTCVMYGIKEEIVSCILVVGGTHIKDV